MATIRSETLACGSSAYGGFIDAVGGIATIVLAVLGLGRTAPEMMVAVATIIFGVALLIQGGAILSEYGGVIFPPGADTANAGQFGTASLSVVFLAGTAGIILGFLALLGVNPGILRAAAIIAFGAALVLSSNSVWQLQVHKRTAPASGAEHYRAELHATEWRCRVQDRDAAAGLVRLPSPSAGCWSEPVQARARAWGSFRDFCVSPFGGC